jgi:hypothetical protein
VRLIELDQTGIPECCRVFHRETGRDNDRVLVDLRQEDGVVTQLLVVVSNWAAEGRE